MIVVKCRDRFEEVKKKADELGELAVKQLQSQLDYLETYGQGDGNKTKCVLWSDCAPFSMGFEMFRINWNYDDVWWFSGGLIFDPKTNTWGVHT